MTQPAARLVFEPNLEYWVAQDEDFSRQLITSRELSSGKLRAVFEQFTGDEIRTECRPLLEVLTRWLVELDPPVHTERRQQVLNRFSTKRFRAMEPAVAQVVAETLHAADSLARPDGVSDIANVVSARAVGLLLDVPVADPATLHRWSTAISAFLGTVYRVDYARAAQEAVFEMTARVSGRPGTDLLTDDALCEDISTRTMMLVGGLETSARLLGMGLLLMLSDSAAMGRIRGGDAAATDEILYQVLADRPPLRRVGRVAIRDTEIAGTAIPAGDLVMVPLRCPRSAGNTSRAVLAFGAGRHFCIGMPLSMTEGRALLPAFARMFPRARLAGEVTWDDNPVYDGLRRLPLVLR